MIRHIKEYELKQYLSETKAPLPAKDALLKIQVGDLLQGKLIDVGEKCFLQLANSTKLLTQIDWQIEKNVLLDFIVVGKESGHLLLEAASMSSHTSYEQENTLMQQVIEKNSLTDKPEMVDVINRFMDKQLPLMKEQLIQSFQFARHYELPAEVLANLASKDNSPRELELERLTEFRNQGVNSLMPVLEETIESMDSAQNGQLIKKLVLENSFKKFEEILQREVGAFPEPNIGMRESFSDKAFGSLVKLLSLQQLKTVNKKLIKEALVLETRDLKDGNSSEIEKITSTSKILRAVLENVNKEEANNRIVAEQLENSIHVLEKYNNEAHYFCFPFKVNDQDASGEFYFFKPKKNKKNNKQGLYMVLALDMPALKKIEVHLIENGSKVILKLKVLNDRIKQILAANENKLIEELNKDHFLLEKIEIELFKEESGMAKNKGDFSLSHMDFKI